MFTNRVVVVPVRRLMWPPAAIFDFHCYRISSETTWEILSKPSQCLDVPARQWFWCVNKYGRTAAIFKIVNCPLLNTVTISLSQLLPDHWSDCFETCLSCSSSGLVVSARKRFRSIDKYSHRQPSLIFTVIASPLKPLEEFCRKPCIWIPLSV